VRTGGGDLGAKRGGKKYSGQVGVRVVAVLPNGRGGLNTEPSGSISGGIKGGSERTPETRDRNTDTSRVPSWDESFEKRVGECKKGTAVKALVVGKRHKKTALPWCA